MGRSDAGDRDYKQIVRDAIDSMGEDIEIKIDQRMSIQFTFMRLQSVYGFPIMIERIPWILNKHNSTKSWEVCSEK